MAEGGWLVDKVIVSLFTAERLPEHAWQDITGQPEPEESMRTLQLGMALQAGPFDGAWLRLSESNPHGRIQLALVPPDAPTPAEPPRHIGGLAARAAQLQGLSLALSNRLQHVRRLGLGATLLHPVADAAEGNQWLAESGFLPDVRLDHSGVDFLYRINRQKELQVSAAEGILVHRLRTFSVVSVVTQHRDEDGVYSTRILPACRLEIDINTVQNHAVDRARYDYERILTALGEWAVEIAERGDVP